MKITESELRQAILLAAEKLGINIETYLSNSGVANIIKEVTKELNNL